MLHGRVVRPWSARKVVLGNALFIYYNLYYKGGSYMASINKRVGKNGDITYQIVFELGTDPVTGKRQRIFKTVKGTKNRHRPSWIR